MLQRVCASDRKSDHRRKLIWTRRGLGQCLGYKCAGEEKLLAQAGLSLQHTSAAIKHPHVSDSDAHALHICLQEMTHSTYEKERSGSVLRNAQSP